MVSTVWLLPLHYVQFFMFGSNCLQWPLCLVFQYSGSTVPHDQKLPGLPLSQARWWWLASCSAPHLLLPGHLAESTERQTGHDHPVITDGARDVVFAAYAGPQGDEGSREACQAAALPLVLRHFTAQNTGQEGPAQADSTVLTAVTYIGAPVRRARGQRVTGDCHLGLGVDHFSLVCHACSLQTKLVPGAVHCKLCERESQDITRFLRWCLGW